MDDFDNFIKDFDIDLEINESKKPVNHISFIIDTSRSMRSKRKFIVKSFNDQLKIIKERKDQKSYVSLIFFNNNYDIFFYEKNVDDVDYLKEEDLKINGLTLLYDTMGNVIKNMVNDIPELNDKKNNHSALVIIITDGYDNISKVFNIERIKLMLKELELLETWTFTFAGVYFDVISLYDFGNSGNKINIQNIDNTSNFTKSITNYYNLRSNGKTYTKYYYNNNTTTTYIYENDEWKNKTYGA